MSVFKTYHPLEVRKSKRLGIADPSAEETTKKTDADAKEGEASAPKRVRMDGVAEVVYDNWKYLCDARIALTQIGEYLQKIEDVIKLALDMKIADADRKVPNKNLQKIKKELDHFSRTVEIKGDLLFSGRFRDKGKIIQMGEKADEQMGLRIEAMHLVGLQLDRARVDSLPSAKKAIEQLIRAKVMFAEMEKIFHTKIDNMESRLMKFEQTSKLEQDSAKGANIKFTEATSRFNHLKLKQEREHKQTGEVLALLLNIKI